MLAGALLIGVTAHTVVGYILAFVAAVFASANVVGGYVVTERMLKMFRRKAPAEPTQTLNTGTLNTGALTTGALNTGALTGAKRLKGLLSRAGKAEQQ